MPTRLLLLALLAVHEAAAASYALYVGRALTEDGVVLIGGTGEEVSSHWLEAVPARRHADGAMVTVGITAEARIPGERFEIPQARETYAYLSMSYSEFAGFPPPLTNGGLNERSVAVRDVWSPSRPELMAMTPTPQRGLSYSDLARIVLERAGTAREGAALIGRLVERHGYATYGGNAHLVADPDEAWVVIEPAGGLGLWAAERLGAEDVRVLYPGYIGPMPDDYADHPDYMGSPNLIEAAVEHGWYDPASAEPFDFQRAYGRFPAGEGPKFLTPAELESELRERAPVTLAGMMAMVRDPRIADDEAGYGQVAALHPDVSGDLALLWAAPTSSLTAPFLPWRVGVRSVPPEFGQHRYLTKDAGRTFLDPDYRGQEATRFAGRVFKRLPYHVCGDPGRFLPETRAALEGFEARLVAEQEEVEAIARTLLAAGRRGLARRHLTFHAHAHAREALVLGEALVDGVEARTRARGGIEAPRGTRINAADGAPTVNCLAGADPDRRAPAGGGAR